VQQGKGRGPRGRRREDPDAAEKEAFRQRVHELETGMGLEKPLAVRVARNELSLSDAVETMARRDRVESLVRRHGFTRALATQIALGHADLDHQLRKRRLAQHLADNAQHSVLDDALADGELRGFGLHGERQLRARVVDVGRFEVGLQKDGEELREHKLQLKYAVAAADLKKFGRALRFCADRGPREPIVRPQDRYPMSDRRLFGLLDRELTVAVTLLEGELLRGRITSLSRFELQLQLKGKLEVVVFRHAVCELSEA